MSATVFSVQKLRTGLCFRWSRAVLFGSIGRIKDGWKQMTVDGTYPMVKQIILNRVDSANTVVEGYEYSQCPCARSQLH